MKRNFAILSIIVALGVAGLAQISGPREYAFTATERRAVVAIFNQFQKDMDEVLSDGKKRLVGEGVKFGEHDRFSIDPNKGVFVLADAAPVGSK